MAAFLGSGQAGTCCRRGLDAHSTRIFVSALQGWWMHAQSMMHTLASILVVVLLAVATGGSATAQAPDDLASLNAQFAKLYGEGKYLEATEIANQFLALAERKFGPDHPYVGTALGNLAMLSRA